MEMSMIEEIIQREWAGNRQGSIVDIRSKLDERSLSGLSTYSLTLIGISCTLLKRHGLAKLPFMIAYAKDVNNPDLRLNLANCLKDLGEFSEAREIYRGSTHVDADPLLLVGAGICEMELGNYADAFTILGVGKQKFPDDYSIQYNAGRILLKLERADEALKCFKKSLEVNPSYAPAALDLATSALISGDIELGVAMYEQIEKAGDVTDKFLRNFMAATLSKNIAEIGLAFFERFSGEVTTETNHMGAELARFVHDSEKCVSLCRKTLEKDPDFLSAEVILCHGLANLGEFEEAGAIKEKIEKNRKTQLSPGAIPNPWAAFAVTDNAKTLFDLAAIYSNASFNKLPRALVHVSEKKGAGSAIGFFSPDFGNHPVGECVLPLFGDRPENLECIGFSVRPDRDDLTDKIEDSLDKFIDCASMTYPEIKEAAQKHRVKTMVDLACFTSGGRANYFALGLAEKQVNYLGYSGTTGANCYDFIIADSFIITPELEKFYSEKTVKLREPLMGCALRSSSEIDAMTRSEYGIPEDIFLFGCIAQVYKYDSNVMKAWARLLRKVGYSGILLANVPDGTKANIKSFFRSEGVDESRVYFAKREPTREMHVSRLKMVDLFLDTAPYNAHSLAADAISAGVPILTLAGQSFASRVAGSIVSAFGFADDCLADGCIDEYVQKGSEIALNESKAAELKGSLCQQLEEKDWPRAYALNFFEVLGQISGDG